MKDRFEEFWNKFDFLFGEIFTNKEHYYEFQEILTIYRAIKQENKELKDKIENHKKLAKMI